MQRYKILRGDESADLAAEVNKALDEGATLAGPLIHCPSCETRWYQPVLYPRQSDSAMEAEVEAARNS